VTNFYDDFVNC